MIRLTSQGSFKNTFAFFDNSKKLPNKLKKIFDKYGTQAINALRAATPRDTGITAESWYHEVQNDGLYFYNRSTVDNIPIVVLLHYGHGTRNGGYVVGRDFINPAITPIFDKLLEDIDEEVRNL